MPDARSRMLRLLAQDLVGPQGPQDEVITARPSDQYLTGALYPDRIEENPEEDEDKDSAEEAEGSPGDAISMQSIRRPSSMGISFAMDAESPVLAVSGSAARYQRRWFVDGTLQADRGTRDQERWVRQPVVLSQEIAVREGLRSHPAVDGLQWWVRGVRDRQRWQVTLILTNTCHPDPGRAESEAATFFQVQFGVRAGEGGRIVSREPRRAVVDDDSETNDLIYRTSREWAVGHTCGASWVAADGGAVVSATWLPEQHVPAMDADGHTVFREESIAATGAPQGAFDSERLADATSTAALTRLLEVVPRAYDRWRRNVAQTIDEMSRAGDLSPAHAARARIHLERAERAARRIEQGIEIIRTDEITRRAFQMAQRAMLTQRRWSEGPGAGLTWRPFQLAFQLLAIAGIARPSDERGGPTDDRRTMDLLWFPTGGGKTEAYLALTAFVLFHRRLRQPENPDRGAGVSVLMRYTLRLLTVQQFERASRLILACELGRRNAGQGDESLGRRPFSIGLWVGRDATPNKVADARSADGAKKARQLARCPACNANGLRWDTAPNGPAYRVACGNPSCPMGADPLPIYTVDEDVYRERPSLLIGTIDKFAQIVRNAQTHSFFASDHVPPELIIQDELHLISGPLGTVAGTYEAAIDALCTSNGIPPKIIGSTATIRRAEDQVRSLFNRRVMQFPPPVLDVGDSCFAVVDRTSPGRLYLGLTTAGRSPKFVLQAACASLLQAASEPVLTNAERDPYWTLVAYFNSLRELGGALVMMHDDVNDSVKMYAEMHGTPRRNLDEEPLELTSRVPSSEIPLALDRLARRFPDQDTGVVLATNMLSVGVDIPRLGLMVVNGQPKSMSEYIQATSRVGRGSVPGLIVTCYNTGRPRDRSHFEAFRTWHQTLYREVEATSVTPFAPRARDRALHAAVVALARHRVPGMLTDPRLTRSRRDALMSLVDALLDRVRTVDPEEVIGVQADIARFLDMWEQRGAIRAYWDDYRPDSSLLVSAERAAAAKAIQGQWNRASVPTPNSMRDVEPDVKFRMTPRLSTGAMGAS